MYVYISIEQASQRTAPADHPEFSSSNWTESTKARLNHPEDSANKHKKLS